MADDGRTTLGKLSRGDVFRTADGRLWRRASAYPTVWGEMVTCSAIADLSGPRNFRTDTQVELIDLPALLKELAELRTLAHDLLLDRDAAYGREAGRGEALGVVLALVPLSQTHPQSHAVARALVLVVERIRALGPVRPLPPPIRQAMRAEELEALLRGCVTALDGLRAGGCVEDVFNAIDAARKLLEENSSDE